MLATVRKKNSGYYARTIRRTADGATNRLSYANSTTEFSKRSADPNFIRARVAQCREPGGLEPWNSAIGPRTHKLTKM